MERRYLQCDLCGDKWDITNTELSGLISPGYFYHRNKVKEGVRMFRIVKEKAIDDERVIGNDLDLCDGCYNRLDRFIFDLTKRKEK